MSSASATLSVMSPPACPVTTAGAAASIVALSEPNDGASVRAYLKELRKTAEAWLKIGSTDSIFEIRRKEIVAGQLGEKLLAETRSLTDELAQEVANQVETVTGKAKQATDRSDQAIDFGTTVMLLIAAFGLATALVVHAEKGVSLERFLSLRVKLSNCAIFGVGLFMWHVILHANGLYKSRRLSPRFAELFDILKATILCTLSVGSLASVFSIRMVTSRFLVLFFFSRAPFLP